MTKDTRRRSAPLTVAKGQASAASAQTPAPVPPMPLESRVPTYSLDDLPEHFDPRKNPTEIEKVAPLMSMMRIGEDTFDATGKQVTWHAIVPAIDSSHLGQLKFQRLLESYTTENLAAHEHVADARRLIMEEAAAPRIAARQAKRAKILTKLKGAP